MSTIAALLYGSSALDLFQTAENRPCSLHQSLYGPVSPLLQAENPKRRGHGGISVERGQIRSHAVRMETKGR